jgi:hypothetical protein
MTDIVDVYNRPAVVEAQYSDTVRVRYQDNGCIDYVPASEVA